MLAIPTQSIRVTSSPAHIPVLIHKGLLAGVIRDKADSVRLYRDRPSALLLPDPFDFPMAERTVTFLSVRVVHRHFSFSSVFYVKRHPLQVAGALDFRITKKARPVPKRAQSCLILCILPATGSAAALCCSQCRGSAVISSVMMVLYPFLLHTVKPGVKRLWKWLYGIVADEKHAEQNRFGIRFVK